MMQIKQFRIFRQPLLSSFLLATLIACGESETNSEVASESEQGRWYSAAQREMGATVFAENCAVCHGDQAQGLVDDWRQRLDDGSLPAPPLNGSAHAWHHPLPVLTQVVNNGGAAFGGKMPAFNSVLSDEQKLAAIAYFQSFWSDDIYGQWMQMGGSD